MNNNSNAQGSLNSGEATIGVYNNNLSSDNILPEIEHVDSLGDAHRGNLKYKDFD